MCKSLLFEEQMKVNLDDMVNKMGSARPWKDPDFTGSLMLSSDKSAKNICHITEIIKNPEGLVFRTPHSLADSAKNFSSQDTGLYHLPL